MKCPNCGFAESKVIDSRPVGDNSSIRRRRECLSCRRRFTTYEVIDSVQLVVIKKDGSKEFFDRMKLESGLIKACQKRPVSIRQMEALIDTVENELSSSPKMELTTAVIGERVMEGLRKLDDVAYIRFVSVYRKFEDVNSFLLEIDKMKRETGE